MKKNYTCIVTVFFLLNLSVQVKAQSKTPNKILAPKVDQQAEPFSRFFFANPDFVKKFQNNFKSHAGSNDLFNFYQLPVDKMVCAVPKEDIKGHIKVFRTKLLPGDIAGTIPNAIPNPASPGDDRIK